MIEDQHQVIWITIAMRSLADGTYTAVVAFEGSVGQPVAGPSNDAIDMTHQHVVEPDERGEPRPVEQLAPSLEELAHALLGRVGPSVLELLLEQVGLEQAAIHGQQLHELATPASRQAPVLGQEQPLLAADRVAVDASTSEELLPAYLLDRLGQIALDVEAVEHDLGQRRMGLHRADVAPPHVHRHHAEPAASPAPELGEKAVERVLLAALADPDHARPSVIPRDGQELALAPAVADFVDADHAQRLAKLARG